MPVDIGRLRQAIRKTDLEHIADLSLEHRTGDPAVVAPRASLGARHKLPIDSDGFELAGNPAAPGVGLGGCIGSAVCLVSAGGWPVNYRPVSAMTTLASVSMS